MDGSGGIVENVVELFERYSCLHVGWWKEQLSIGLAKCCSKVFGSSHNGIICGCGGHFDVMGKPVDGVDNAGCIGQWCPDVEALVVM
jgi:hypothetical protein